MIEHVKWALAQKIGGNTKLVLISLANHAGEDGYCWPGQEVIGVEASMTARNVRRVIIMLVDKGYIRIERRHRPDGSRSSNGYQLLMGGQEDKLSGRPAIQQDTQGRSKRTTVSSQEAPVEPPKKESASARADAYWEEFWEKYPRKVSKPQARTAWKTAIKKTDPVVILMGLDLHLPALLAREPGYRPHPATWLNGERWGDEVEEPKVQPTERGGKQQRPPIDPQREWEYR